MQRYQEYLTIMKPLFKFSLLLALIVGGKFAKTTEPAVLAATPAPAPAAQDTALLNSRFAIPVTATALQKPSREAEVLNFNWF